MERLFKKKTIFFFLFFIICIIANIAICSDVIIEKAYAADLPLIEVDTEEWAAKVTVSISYPEALSQKRYKIIRNGVEGEFINYVTPFDIVNEGENTIRAYYSDTQYVSRIISNVDKTPPTVPTITIDVNLNSTRNIVVLVQSSDTKSGINAVRVLPYDYPLVKIEGGYEIDLTQKTMGENFAIEVSDAVGNKRVSSTMYYSVYNFVDEIREYSNIYNELGDGTQYTVARWAEIVSKFSALEMAFKAPIIDSSEVNALKLQIDELCLGEFEYSILIVETLIGMDSNITYALTPENLSAPLGSKIVLEISNSLFTTEERTTYEQMLKTLSGYSKIRVFAINLELKEKGGESVTLDGTMNIEFLLPYGYNEIKFYDLEDGIFTEVQLAVSSGGRSARVESDGDFFIVAQAEDAQEQAGYIIGGKLYSYGLFYGTIGGILGLLIIAFFTTYLLIHNKDKLSAKKLISKIKRNNLERKKNKKL